MEYAQQLDPAGPLAALIANRIAAIDPTSALTPTHIARRALFAGGCIGCHQRSNFGPNNDLGNGVTAPVSGGFVHTNEFVQEDCGDGDNSCFLISSALRDSFLPHRKQVMDDFLNGGPCCEGPAEILPIEPVPVLQPIEIGELDVEAMVESDAAAKASASPLTVAGHSTTRAH